MFHKCNSSLCNTTLYRMTIFLQCFLIMHLIIVGKLGHELSWATEERVGFLWPTLALKPVSALSPWRRYREPNVNATFGNVDGLSIGVKRVWRDVRTTVKHMVIVVSPNACVMRVSVKFYLRKVPRFETVLCLTVIKIGKCLWRWYIRFRMKCKILFQLIVFKVTYFLKSRSASFGTFSVLRAALQLK